MFCDVGAVNYDAILADLNRNVIYLYVAIDFHVMTVLYEKKEYIDKIKNRKFKLLLLVVL